MNNKFDIWTEKYRPKKVEDYVFRDDELKNKIYEWISNPNNKKIPFENIMLCGSPGIGKTTMARMLCNELKIDPGDVMEINASRENNADTIREKIVNYCSTWANGDYKVIILDECLEENEEIQLADGSSMALKDFEINKKYNILNVNMNTKEIEEDIGEVLGIKHDQELYEVELEDGRKIVTTLDHPYLVFDENDNLIQKELKDLNEGDIIYSIDRELNVVQKINPNRIKIKKITKINNGTVRVFTAYKNHTILTKNGIATHNCDRLSPLAQDILRAEVEKYYDSVRFIGTCNHPRKLSDAIKSRFEIYNFESLKMEEFVQRILYILDQEKVEFNGEDLLPYIDVSYPDLRKCINLLSQHTINNSLGKLNKESDTKDYLIDMVELFKQKKYTEARKLVCSQVKEDELDNVFRYLYQNLHLFSDTDEGQSQAIVIIAEGMRDNTFVSDHEINLAATFVKLGNIDV